MPWWVLIWIKRSPLVFLVLSVTCFSIGLCCFAYASEQVCTFLFIHPHFSFNLSDALFNKARVTSTITTVLTAFTSFGLAAVSAWFASERWAFSRHRGQKWLNDILSEANDRFLQLPGIFGLIKVLKVASRQMNNFRKSVLHGCAGFISSVSCWKSRNNVDDDVENALPTTAAQIYSSDSQEPTNLFRSRASDVTAVMSELSTLASPLVPPTPINSPIVNETGFTLNSPTTPEGLTSGKQLWKNAVKSVKMRGTLGVSLPNSSLATVPGRAEPTRQRTISSGFAASDTKKSPSPGEILPFSRSRVSGLVPKLQELEATHDLAAHTALVRHMEFSPDGRFLATSRCVHVFSINYSYYEYVSSSWDKTSVIFRVGVSQEHMERYTPI